MPEIPPTEQLVEQITRFTKTMHRMKLALTKEVPDRAAYGLLHPLAESDKRAAELAELMHSDPSTVSRQISQLVASDLVQRVPDQHDGRAAKLSLTERGRDFCTELTKHRANALAQAVVDWSEEDKTTFTALLARLNDDMDAHHNDILAGFRNVYEKAEATTSPTANKEQA